MLLFWYVDILIDDTLTDRSQNIDKQDKSVVPVAN